ncbi:ABC transporter permease [Corynebacterium kutscheri]|uniref:ABC transporter permease n=1 Tax=Corynebacterium kutscheri TaxID=35755 RepID=A0AB38VV64_9CORY|nr:ABC transporter permease [Corynebacterium kutscheri]VEH08819.1 ABC transporter permease [Corynebacterium kutscheri]VEH79948.1 ABC transporter permease [Corynebacterium kutscheri]
MNYSSFSTITIVSIREIKQALRSRGIMITLCLLLIAVVGGTAIATFFINKNNAPENKTIVISGFTITSIVDSDYYIKTANSRADAMLLVEEGEAKAGFVLEEEKLTLLHDGSISPDIQGLLQTFQQHIILEKTLTNLGLTTEQFAARTATIEIIEYDLNQTKNKRNPENDWDIHAAIIGVFILMLSITLFAANVGARVTEEKSSRIIEIIIATVKPLDFLTGKILGNVVFGTASTVLILGIGAASLKISGLIKEEFFNWKIIPALLIAYLLGIVFFSAMYAAAGAMVQRTEDLQSTQTPVMLLIFTVLYTPLIFLNQINETWMHLIAWIPPLSIGHAPLQYAAGNITGWQFSLSMIIMLIFTTSMLWVVARIYAFAILYNGAKLTWSQALQVKTT